LVGKRNKEKNKKMNKRYLPAIASLLIIAIALTSFTPVLANLPTRLSAYPTLRVTTIAEDDELRQTGVMWMADTEATFVSGLPLAQDLMAQFKILVSYNGVPVTPTSVYCQFVEKDKANPLKNQQFPAENLASVPKENPNFICKFRWAKAGVGVLDVYYIGDAYGQYIADYILVVGVDLALGRSTVWGTEIQDICLLGWPVGTVLTTITKGNGDIHQIIADPLGEYTSCEDLALLQKQAVGIGIPWT
jgi:hypothetical protein